MLEVHCYESNEQAWVSTIGEQTTEEDRMDPEGKDKPVGLVMTLNQPRGQMRSQWIYRQRRQVMRPVGSAVDGKQLGERKCDCYIGCFTSCCVEHGSTSCVVAWLIKSKECVGKRCTLAPNDLV